MTSEIPILLALAKEKEDFTVIHTYERQLISKDNWQNRM